MTTKPLIGTFSSVGDTTWTKADGTSLGSINGTTGALTIGSTSLAATHKVQSGNSAGTAIIETLTIANEIVGGAAQAAGGGPSIVFRDRSSGGGTANWPAARIRAVGNATNNSHGLSFDITLDAGNQLVNVGGVSPTASWQIGKTTGGTTHTVYGSLSVFETASSGGGSIMGVAAGPTYNGMIIANNINGGDFTGTQVNNTLPSWGIDLGGRNVSSYGASDAITFVRRAAGSSTITGLTRVNSDGSFTIGSGNFNSNYGQDRISFGSTVPVFYVLNNSSVGVQLANGGTAWAAQSDERIKKNIIPLDYGLSQVLALNPVRFDYNTDESDDSKRMGFVAQEVLPIVPEAVSGDEASFYSLSTTELIPTLVKAIQELKADLDAAKARITELEGN